VKKLVVVGGGTAGWITALLLKKFYCNYNVTVVASSEIGILGAGEGTTPHFLDLAYTLNINITELIAKSKATIKTGIKFTNWNGDEKSYFHPFHIDPLVSLDSKLRGVYANELVEKNNLDELVFTSKLSEDKKVPLDNATGSRYSNIALHFDARLLAEYLKELAISRGVVYIDGKINKVNTDDQNFVQSITLENNISVAVDFIFDCSGFKRLVLGEVYETEWVSFSESLPMDSAIPLFLPLNGTPAPITEAIAMKNGWVWKIPTQDRYGCGYVFDSSHCSKEEALKEVSDYFKVDIDATTVFKFDAGNYKQVVVNNCMALGLAQGFIEPLEATSIWTTIEQLRLFIEQDGLNNLTECFQKQFNHSCFSFTDNIRQFIHYHYLTKREDSLFWRNFKSKNTTPDEVIFKINYINSNTNLKLPAENIQSFPSESWLLVGAGTGIFDKEIFSKFLTGVDKNRVEHIAIEFKKKLIRVSKSCVSHEEVLKEPYNYGL